MNRFLLIDVGNSQTKWALSTRAAAGAVRETPSTPAGIRAAFRRAPRVVAALVSSVVPRLDAPLKRALRARGIESIHFISHRSDLGIGIRYPKPASIGADRLANAAATAHEFGGPAIVIDFGTAVTFDILSARNEYLGGVICPGLRAMTHYLHEKTALLPELSLHEPRRAIGKSTVEAMRVGAVVGYRGLISGILVRLKRELGSRRIRVIATGGYSSLIARKVREIEAIRPKLTLDGLRIAACRIFKSTIPPIGSTPRLRRR